MKVCVAAVCFLVAACSALSIPLEKILTPNPVGENFAVLVAGSNSWGNYRHQSDVCHSYQVLVKHGFNPDNIIVMMFDDIAHNTENPTPGVIINWPNGDDVYKGVSKDYTGAAVTPENFLNILQGKPTKGGNGKVLKSGPNDNVFVFFSDHGGPGIIAFPSELLQATDLNKALQYMFTNKMYNQLVFYLEACEAGSMFNTLLPANINVFATTASPPDASSYACYFDSKRNTYLGDVYSVNWMEDSDMADLTKETLQEQFVLVKKETNTSVCCDYGTMSFNTETLSQFQAGPKHTANVRARRSPNPNDGAVNSRDVDLAVLQHRIAAASANSAEQSKLVGELNAIQAQRAVMVTMYESIVSNAAGAEHVALHMARRLPMTKASVDCVHDATTAFNQQCFSYNTFDYGLHLAMSFVSMCESGVSTGAILGAITTVCPTKSLTLGFAGGVY